MKVTIIFDRNMKPQRLIMSDEAWNSLAKQMIGQPVMHKNHRVGTIISATVEENDKIVFVGEIADEIIADECPVRN